MSPSLIAKVETAQRISTPEVIGACDDVLKADGALSALWPAAAASWRTRGRTPVDASREHARGPRDDCGHHTTPLERAIAHAEGFFGVRLDRAMEIGGRAAVCFPSDRGTWIRIASRRPEDISTPDLAGVDLSLQGSESSAWLASAVWRGEDFGTIWRADEMLRPGDSH